MGYRLEQAQRDYDIIMGGACMSSFQDINRTYTNNERALAVRIDCSTEAQWVRHKMSDGFETQNFL